MLAISSRLSRSAAFCRAWLLRTERMVPLRERITIDSVLGARGGVADAAQQLAVGDAGGDEERVVPGDQVVGVQHPVEVVPGVEGLASLRRRPWARAGLG